MTLSYNQLMCVYVHTWFDDVYFIPFIAIPAMLLYFCLTFFRSLPVAVEVIGTAEFNDLDR